jgi:hypothetical protein
MAGKGEGKKCEIFIVQLPFPNCNWKRKIPRRPCVTRLGEILPLERYFQVVKIALKSRKKKKYFFSF